LLKTTGNVVGPNSVIAFRRTFLPFEAFRTSHWCNACLYRSVCQ